jgi:hypothetical protein
MTRALAASLAAAALLVGAYLALGGGGYDVDRPPDPCTRTEAQDRPGLLAGAERVGMTALNGAACELGLSRERLLLVLAGEVEPPPGLDEEAGARAFRNGLGRALTEEERAGRLGETEAALFRAGLELVPVEELLRRLFGRG